jgi:hypothetical protein
MAIWKNMRKLPAEEVENVSSMPSLPVLSVLKTISQIYQELKELRKVQFDMSSPNLQQFAIDFFLFKYGLQALALKHLFVFLVNIRRNIGKHSRVDTFARLTGLLEFNHASNHQSDDFDDATEVLFLFKNLDES